MIFIGAVLPVVFVMVQAFELVAEMNRFRTDVISKRIPIVQTGAIEPGCARRFNYKREGRDVKAVVCQSTRLEYCRKQVHTAPLVRRSA
jgi:hypothetical protein